MSKSLSQLTAKTDIEDADIYLMRRGNVDYKQTHETLFDPLRYSENVYAYDNAASYEDIYPCNNKYVLYNSVIWECISAGAIVGVAPGSDATKWRKVYAAQLSHFINEDSGLAYGSSDEVTANEIRTFIDDRADESIIKHVRVAISAAQVKTLNSLPVNLVDAPGIGYAIEVVSVSCKFNYVAAVAFDHDQLIIQPIGSTHSPYVSGATFLNGTANAFLKLAQNTVASTGNALVENAALKAITTADSTTTGTSNIVVYVAYRIITI